MLKQSSKLALHKNLAEYSDELEGSGGSGRYILLDEEDKDLREALKWCGIVALGLAVLWVLIIICMFTRVRRLCNRFNVSLGLFRLQAKIFGLEIT